jgi:hypothetical protein
MTCFVLGRMLENIGLDITEAERFGLSYQQRVVQAPGRYFDEREMRKQIRGAFKWRGSEPSVQVV